MIIVSLFEGLGNQMFQYATARRLADKHSTILKLDISSFESNKRRKYGLHCFQIQENMATQDEINMLLKRPKNQVERFFNKVGIISDQSRNLLQEKSFDFDSSILTASNNKWLHGFWQSEKYFSDIQDIIQSEFSIKYPQNTQNEEISKKIKFHESIALHVRRGDYVQNEESNSNQFHQICGLDYYKRCISYLAKRVSDPHLFVFSDEPQWVKENLKINFPMTFIEDNNGFRSYEDLRFMSQCKHNIIANSSFSWWGAWLNPNPNKIVCAPQQWFKNKLEDTKYLISDDFIPWYKDNFIDIKDLIPETWIKF
jgi:hypothetical protein